MNVRKLVKIFIPRGMFKRIEPFGHLLEAVFFNVINGFPARGMRVIGVTGTNGKTTTAYLIHKMLQEAGYKVGLNTTVAYGVNDDIQPQMHHMTNVSVPEMMQRLKWFKQQDIDFLVLETTSHALAQNRVWGIPYSLAVMTNITHEHLSYHGTFERYLAAKVKLFKLANRNLGGMRTGIVNAEDEHSADFASAIANTILYGKGGDVLASKVKLTSGGSRYTAKVAGEEYKIQCHLPGSFNVSNSLATVAVGHALGLTKKQIEQGIAALKNVEGRMTAVDEGQNFDVIVDYAHSPDSFEKLFSDVRPVVKGKIIAVFGSLGGGDKAKRPEQGKIAGKYADIVVLTQEDDRQEDPEAILEDIAVGARKSGKKDEKDLFKVHDRTKAIEFAVKMAKKGDMVLLLGKGHEKTQEDAKGEHPWNEIVQAEKALNKLRK